MSKDRRACAENRESFQWLTRVGSVIRVYLAALVTVDRFFSEIVLRESETGSTDSLPIVLNF